MSGRHDKQIDWGIVQSRLATRGPDGLLLSAITGAETEEELRALIYEFVQSCAHKHKHEKCPFCILSGLSPDSQRSVVSKLKRQDMVGLFEMECASRNEAFKPSSRGS